MGDPAYFPPKAPPCLRCRHYFVTYQPTMPHGCRDWNIRSRNLPSWEVQAATGRPCPRFEQNPRIT